MRILLLLFGVFLLANTSFGQRNIKDSTVQAVHLGVSYAFQSPFGDLESRFGSNNNLGVLLNIKTEKNWFFGVDGTYIFGEEVHEPGLLSNLMTDDGEVIDNEGKIANLQIQERGFSVIATSGRLFPVVGPNNNSGILVKGGVGFIQHKIRLEHQVNAITQLEDPYLKGYDRLTNGFALSQFVGYYHMSNSRLANFFVGVEGIQGFTQSRRDLNYDTGMVDDQPRFDGLIGIRAGWCIHFYKRVGQDFYYN